MKNLLINKIIDNTQYRKISLKNLALMIPLGFALQVFASILLTAVLSYFPEIAERYLERLDSIIQITPNVILSVCFIFPVCEELVFRGLGLGVLRKFAPFFIANITQALVFGIYHGNIVQGIYAFLLGLFIGWICKVCGSVVYTCVLHMSINLLGMFISEIVPEDTAVVLQAIYAVLALGVIIYISRIVKRMEADNEIEVK